MLKAALLAKCGQIRRKNLNWQYVCLRVVKTFLKKLFQIMKKRTNEYGSGKKRDAQGYFYKCK
jgi:hypothetical protein